MKIAVTGKGGVGKTTFAATLARMYAAEGRNVLTADVDPDANLGMALGFTDEEIAEITPISKMRDFIQQRTGANGANYGIFFKINPKVDDIPELFAKEKNGVKLLVLGTVETAGAGCVCPEAVVLKRVLSNLIIERDEVVIMDMEAGLEHLGRGTAESMDQFVVVIEPGERSVQTYRKIKELAAELGIYKVRVVGNKVRSAEDEEFIRSRIPEEDLLGIIHFSDDITEADRRGMSPYDIGGDAVEEIRAIKAKIDAED